MREFRLGSLFEGILGWLLAAKQKGANMWGKVRYMIMGACTLALIHSIVRNDWLGILVNILTVGMTCISLHYDEE